MKLPLLPILVFASAACIGCAAHELTPAGARVLLSWNPPPSGCTEITRLVRTQPLMAVKGSNHPFMATTELRNEAGRLGANYVHQDAPAPETGRTAAASSTVSGVAYRCGPR